MSQSEADKEDTFRGTDQSKKLKSTSGWNENSNGTDAVGFAALPAGYGGQGGYFDFLGIRGYWWSSTTHNTLQAWTRSLSYSNDRVSRSIAVKKTKYSVRCIKD